MLLGLYASVLVLYASVLVCFCTCIILCLYIFVLVCISACVFLSKIFVFYANVLYARMQVSRLLGLYAAVL